MALTLLACLVLLTAEGALAGGGVDPTFSGDGIAAAPQLRGYGQTLAVQTDGKIVVAGCSGTSSEFGVCGGLGGNSEDFAVARFRPDGTLDPTFSGDGQLTVGVGIPDVDDQAHDLAIQSDGKIVVAGCHACNWLGSSDILLARFNHDGTLDTSFGTTLGHVVSKVAGLDPRRPEHNGLVIDDFFVRGRSYVAGVGIQRSGRIVVGGWTNAPPLGKPAFALARFMPDGSRDTSFGALGHVITTLPADALAFDMVLLPDDRIVLAGDMAGSALVARYLPDGRPDFSFSGDGWATMPFGSSYRAVQGVAVTPDAGIVIAGQHHGTGGGDFAVGKLNPSGSPDGSFGTGGMVFTEFGTSTSPNNDVALGVAVQTDGNIVAVGYSSGGMGSEHRQRTALARYRSNGTLDQTFGDGGKLLTLAIQGRDTAIQWDGKILVAGRGLEGLSVLRLIA